MKKYIVICGLSAALLMSGCRSDDISPSAGLSEPVDTVLAETETETGSEYSTDRSVPKPDNDEDNEDYEQGDVSPYKGADDFYIKVTDYRGKKWLLYYEGADEDSGADFYFNEVTLNPDSLFGFSSALSEECPARKEKAFFGMELKDFIDQCGIVHTDCSYHPFEGVYKGALVNDDDNSERFEGIINEIASFEPEFVPGLIDSDIELELEYDPRYPLTSVYISDNHWSSLSRVFIDIQFATYNGRIVGKMYINDYRELKKLVESGKRVTPDELERAYYESASYISDWFYADNTSLYDYALKTVLLNDRNEIRGVKQDRSDSEYFPNEGFSENIAGHFNKAGTIPEGYSVSQFRDVYFIIPDSGNHIDMDTKFSWETDDGEISFRMEKGTSLIENTTWSKEYEILNSKDPIDGYTVYTYEKGTFNNWSCRYVSYYCEDTKAYEDRIKFTDASGNDLIAVCRLDSDKRTSGYDTFVKNVLGSITIFGFIDETSNAKLKLAYSPSRYASDGMKLADAYSTRGNSYIAYYPDMMTVTFYTLDWNNNYDTGFECYLEKQKSDGLWYRVEPLGGGIVQANSGSKHFENVFEEGREFVDFDLAAYPLLPPGYYRIVKPYWDEGGSDHSQYAAFYEFRMTEDTGYGSGIAASAKCSHEEYTSAVREIAYTVETEDDGSFIESDIADIERLENGKWVSVRTAPVRTNSIGGSYALRFSGMEETIDTGNFDISVPGEYRIRISIGEYDIETDDNMFVNNYDTVYAYFSIK